MQVRRLVVAAIALTALSSFTAHAEKNTVCTITVNSPDEKQVFRRYLPDDQFQFVELIERGRPDWLASACQKQVQCDVLVISGHFDGGTEFYSDKLDARESLPVEEIERVSCSDSCPGLFSKLKEVYLFGCNTLNGETGDSVAAEITRTLIRSGESVADAEKLAQSLNQRYGESNRDAMRRIFADVPVIYGFSSLAPLGALAGPMLGKYFQNAPAGEIGSGRVSPSLLRQFAASSMIATSGLVSTEPRAVARAEACQYVDQRQSAAQKVEAIHRVLGREMAEVRMHFDRIEKLTTSLVSAGRSTPEVADALGSIARDEQTRARFLRFARNTDRPEIRTRMIRLADTLGWLPPEAQRQELMDMIGDQLVQDQLSFAEVDLICSLNRDQWLDGDRHRLNVPAAMSAKPAQSAILACLGSSDAHTRVLRALTSPDDRDVQIAQVYLRHHPIADVAELRTVAAGIARMSMSDAQIRALDTLAFHYVADRESLDLLARLFSIAKSLTVQRAIAGIFIRSDYQSLAKPDLVRVLQQYRVKSPDGADLIDMLIRRLQMATRAIDTPA
ncbi:MAG: hypothetical protein ABIS68_11725 [Casimicrobiaceae bacterium]